MGDKYEIRWKTNRKCPLWAGHEWTDDLAVACSLFGRAVDDGYTCVEMELHDWRNCPTYCNDREECEAPNA